VSSELDPELTALEAQIRKDSSMPTDPSSLVGKWGDLTADSNRLTEPPTDASILANKLVSPPTDGSGLTGKWGDLTADSNQLGASPTDQSLLNIKMAPVPTDASSLAGKLGGITADSNKLGAAQTDPSLLGLKIAPAATDGSLDSGLNSGLTAGLDSGLNTGLDSGLDSGLNSGLDSGLSSGLDSGLSSGLNAGIDTVPGGSPDSSLHVPEAPMLASDPAVRDVLFGAGSAAAGAGVGMVSPTIGAQAGSTMAPRDTGPVHVHGYVAFVDPTTSAEYLPHQANGLGTSIAPGAVTLRFRSTMGDVRDVTAGGGAYWYREAVRQPNGMIVTRAANSGGIAWYYDVQLNLDDSNDDPRPDYSDLTPGSPALAAVVYNPQRWEFVEVVSVGPVAGEGTGVGQVFTRRATPFADLPDPRF
jgi:hypothetical protein